MCDDSSFATGWQVMVEMRRTQHLIEVTMDQWLVNWGITYAQYRALEVLVAAPSDLHVSELARRLRLTRQATADTVKKLERVDYVQTEREPHTRYVVVTARGRSMLQKLRNFARLPDELDSGLTPQERGHLLWLLRKTDRTTTPPGRPTWWLDD
jgi:DNA-binding MarR family transcriptional regulator